jgi:hypothetical protein
LNYMDVVVAVPETSVVLIYMKYDVLDTGFCVLFRVECTQLDSIDRASSNLRRQKLALSIESNRVVFQPEDGDRVQSPKHVF